MTKIYGQLFLNKHGLEDNGTWFDVLCDLTPKAIDKGVERLMNLYQEGKFSEFPPNCLQFRALCLDFYNALKLPTVEKAYQEVMSRAYTSSPHWSHEAVKYTAMKLGADFLKMDDVASAYAVFKDVYEKVCHLVKQGHELPKINKPVMIAKTTSKEVAIHHLRKMRQLLGVAS